MELDQKIGSAGEAKLDYDPASATLSIEFDWTDAYGVTSLKRTLNAKALLDVIKAKGGVIGDIAGAAEAVLPAAPAPAAS